VETATIHVNFARPAPLFPLRSVVMLPHAMAPLHVFEPRYRQMVQHALDGPGLVALAVLAERREELADAVGEPPVRPVVCLGRIAQHEQLADGRFNVLLQGVCRARIRREMPPEGDRLYRMALLQPLEASTAPTHSEARRLRRRLRRKLSQPPLTQLALAQGVCNYLQSEEKPVEVALELMGMSIAQNPQRRYELLAEPDPQRRARIIEGELDELGALLRKASPQLDAVSADAPKGVVWN